MKEVVNYIMLNRKVFRHPLWNTNREYSRFEAWLDIIRSASFTPKNDVKFGDKTVICDRGEWPISIRFLARRWQWTPMKVRSFLKYLEKEEMITKKNNTANNTANTHLIVCNYDRYNGEQHREQHREQHKYNKDNNKERKNIVEYLNKITGKNFKTSSNSTKRLISARINDGFTLEDFITVINVKSSQWLNSDMEQYLRPTTLFSPSKFESYLNEKPKIQFAKRNPHERQRE